MPDYSPTFVKRDPVTGLTFYDFEGHIKADGIDLDIGTDVLSAENRVSWNRATDNVLLAYLGAVANANATWAQLHTDSDATGALAAQVQVASQGTIIGPQTASVSVQAGTKSGGILDSTGASDWVRLHSVPLGPSNIPENNSTPIGVTMGDGVFLYLLGASRVGAGSLLGWAGAIVLARYSSAANDVTTIASQAFPTFGTPPTLTTTAGDSRVRILTPVGTGVSAWEGACITVAN